MVKQDDFKTRLLIEKLALDEKVEKLHKFMSDGEQFSKLSQLDGYHLIQQLGIMQSYQYILQTRIDRICGSDAKLDDETIEEIKQESRFLKAIAATKQLPEGWTIDISYDSDGGRVFLCDAEGESVSNHAIYDDFDTLPEQIENAIAYAKAHAAD